MVSKGCKCCCGFTTVLVLLVVVAAGVGIFMAPTIAQGSLDKASIALTNVSMLPCAGFGMGPGIAEVRNDVTYKVSSPLPIGVEMQATNMSLFGYIPNKTLMGTFIHPKTSLKPGTTEVTFTVSLQAPQSDVVVTQFLSAILFKPIPVTLSGEDIVLQVGPIKIPHLKMSKDFNCTFGAQLEGNFTKPFCPTVGTPDLAIAMSCVEAPIPANRSATLGSLPLTAASAIVVV
jgi:hypothetical protein